MLDQARGFRLLTLCGMLAAMIMLDGCGSVSGPPVSTEKAVDTPVAAGPDTPPGSYEDFIVNVGRRVYFSENSANLDDTAKRTLDNQAAWLGNYSRYRVKIEGFADEKGGADFNKALGLKRAQNAMAYLISKGLAPNRVRAKSFGN